MGVYIKNMEKPKSCEECPITLWGLPKGCNFVIEMCPITEVKAPHGRLIDADALLNQWCEDMCNPKPNCEEDCAVYDYVRLAPTVIEAEVE